VQELKKRFGGKLPPDMNLNNDTDATLTRYLVARSYDLDASEKMLRDTIKWRADNGIADILTDPPPERVMATMRAAFPHALHDFDKLGRPVYIEKTGRIDPEMIKAKLSKEDVIRGHLWMMEYQNRVLMKQASVKTGRTVDSMLNILDVEGISTSHISSNMLDIFKAVAQIDQDHYPEQLGAAYIVNVPLVFTMIYSAVSIFLDKRTRGKVFILRSGSNQTKELLKAMDEDVLPEFLGGKCKCVGGCVSGKLNCTQVDNKTIHHLAAEKFVEGLIAGKVTL